MTFWDKLKRLNKNQMKYLKWFKRIIILFLIILSIISIATLIVTLINLFQWNFNISKKGFEFLIEEFNPFTGLYAGNIVLISVYYWMRQLENIEQSNRKKIVDNTISEGRYFNSNIQPIAGDFIKKFRDIDETLFDIAWDYSNFTFKSLEEQNQDWLDNYQIRHQQPEVGNYMKNNQIFFELDSLSGSALYDDVDDDLLFKLIGKGFLSQVEVLYPFISVNRDEHGTRFYFHNIPELYKKWKPKATSLSDFPF